MADLARKSSALSPTKHALLERRLADRRPSTADLRLLSRQPGVNTFRASLAQERLWCLEQIAPGRAVANVAGAFHASGRFDLVAFRRSLEALAARHESLRTLFAVVDGIPMQVISPIATIGLRVVDRRGDAADDRAAAWAGACADAVAEADRPFDVAHGPLCRVVVFTLADDTSLVAIVLHHLIADAWSVGILVRDLATGYRAFVAGGEADVSPMAIQYADYAAWQRAQCRDGRHAAMVAYWKRRLADAPYPRVASGNRLTFGSAARRGELSGSLTTCARALGRREGVTLFEIALAAWQVVVGRWVESDDVTVIAPMANRERPEVADVIGFFVNLVALRTHVGGDPSFRELLCRVKEVARGAQRYQELPFEMVLDAVAWNRSLARPPLSPIAFGLEPATFERITLPDVEIMPVELAHTTSRTDLTLFVREHEEHLRVRLEYHPDLYDAQTVERLLQEFLTTLTRAVVDPERRLSELSPPATSRGSEGVVTVWERFATQVAATPEAVAVRAPGAVVTYRQLAARAVAVATTLAARGIERETLVAVWGARGVALLSAMLGILRAGAAYLPLDPRWPPARLAQVLRESRVRFVVTGQELPAALVAARGDAEDTPRWELLPIMDAAGEPAGANDATVSAAGRSAPSDLAYVVYTSGSTGAPKGAMVEHAALVNHLDAKRNLLALGPGDRVAQTASAGFDISLWQYLAVLLVGGEVVVIDDGTARDPERLVAAVAALGVTVLETVPALLRLVLEMEEAGETHGLAGLRWLVVTGDALPPDLCRTWLRRHPTIPLVNAYGPTECGDDVTHHVVTTPPAAAAVRVPIGTPIANVAVHVLDRMLTPVAVGEVGELCIGGIAVGRGYLHDPQRTAAAFLSDPFDPRPGARLYRTGDLGRRLADGTLECHGRLDQQVKIRGTRVEPAEIEAVLLQHPAVREAAIVADTDPNGESRLVAYVAAGDLADGAGDGLRRFVAERLPEAMVPSAVVTLAMLPVGANGKFDRRALPPSTFADPVPESSASPTALERLFLEIWGAVLRTTVPSTTDNFFALGGDSLSSIQVAARARRHGMLLTPQDLFRHQTIAELARYAATVPGPCAEQGLVTGDTPLSAIQRLFFAADLPAVHHYNMAVLLEVDERLDPDLLALAVEHILRHHDMLRARFRWEGGEWRQTIAGADGAVPFARVDLAGHADGELAPIITAAAEAWQRSLDLGGGPLLRVVWFDLGPDRPGRLLIIIHHLACDVVSWPFLLDDLVTVYGQLRQGEPIGLPAKASSYRAWAERLVEYGRSPERAADLERWRCEHSAPTLRLPRDLPGRAAAIADMDHVTTVFAPTTAAAIRAHGASAGVSVESVLLTALVTAVAALDPTSAADGLLLYLERHGRAPVFPELDVSRTVGWFTAVVPVRVPLAASRRPADTLTRVDEYLRAIPDGGLGFGVLRSGMAGAEAAALLAALPHPETSFNYLGHTDPPERAGWRRAGESPGCELGRAGTRPTILDVTAEIAGAALRIDWAYDATVHRRTTITRLAERFQAVLATLIGPPPSLAAPAREGSVT